MWRAKIPNRTRAIAPPIAEIRSVRNGEGRDQKHAASQRQDKLGEITGLIGLAQRPEIHGVAQPGYEHHCPPFADGSSGIVQGKEDGQIGDDENGVDDLQEGRLVLAGLCQVVPEHVENAGHENQLERGRCHRSIPGRMNPTGKSGNPVFRSAR